MMLAVRRKRFTAPWYVSSAGKLYARPFANGPKFYYYTGDGVTVPASINYKARLSPPYNQSMISSLLKFAIFKFNQNVIT